MIEVNFTAGSEPVESMDALTSMVHRYHDLGEHGKLIVRRDEKTLPLSVSSGMGGLKPGVYVTTFDNGDRWEFEWDGTHIMERVRIVNHVYGLPAPARNHAIMVFEWKRAPKNLRQFSTHEGDEDWVIYFPAHFSMSFDNLPSWVDAMNGTGAPDMVQFADGSFVVIGAHA